MTLDPNVRERLQGNLRRHEVPYGSCSVLCNDLRAVFEALNNAERVCKAAQALKDRWPLSPMWDQAAELIPLYGALDVWQETSA